MDVGCYLLQLAIMVFGEMPRTINASGTKGKTGTCTTNLYNKYIYIYIIVIL